MCQPFAMSAWTLIGTVRPETTSRAADPPTTLQRTGRSEAASGAVAKTADVPGSPFSGLRIGALLAAASGNKTRYADLFIRLEIYPPRRDPCGYVPLQPRTSSRKM